MFIEVIMRVRKVSQKVLMSSALLVNPIALSQTADHRPTPPSKQDVEVFNDETTVIDFLVNGFLDFFADTPPCSVTAR
jgi:hypothetical protein